MEQKHMEQTIMLAWKPKQKALLARGARVLEFKHRNGDLEISAPSQEGGFYAYKVSETYARSLLGECGHHFKLLVPAKMLVPFPNRNGGRDYREVLSVATKRGFRADAEGEEDEDPVKPPVGEVSLGAREPIGPDSAERHPTVITNIPPPVITNIPPPPLTDF